MRLIQFALPVVLAIVFSTPTLGAETEYETEFHKTPDAPNGRLYSIQIEEIMKECTIKSVAMTIVKVQKTKDGEVNGFTGKEKSGQNSTLEFAPLSYLTLSQVEFSWVDKVIKVGKPVIVKYHVCGSGGFESLQSLVFP